MTLTTLGNAVCWGLVVVVWIVGAVHTLRRGPPRRARAPISPSSLAAIVVVALAVTAAHEPLHELTVRAEWVRVLGLAVLAASAAFTIWLASPSERCGASTRSSGKATGCGRAGRTP